MAPVYCCWVSFKEMRRNNARTALLAAIRGTSVIVLSSLVLIYTLVIRTVRINQPTGRVRIVRTRDDRMAAEIISLRSALRCVVVVVGKL